MHCLIPLEIKTYEKLHFMYIGEQWLGKRFLKVGRDLCPVKFKQVCMGTGLEMSRLIKKIIQRS